MRSEWGQILSRITLITQLGLSLVTPPLLLIWGAVQLQSRFGVGDWILLCAIPAGILSGGCAVWSLLRAELESERRREAKKQNKGDRRDET